ncbi:Protein sidekick-1 [Varanus komodoensis]|nr:Protein sidekick-1 [Varanus komodoensis]
MQSCLNRRAPEEPCVLMSRMYVIPSLQRSDAGFYQCVVRNRMGALMQRKSEVQVAYMGNFQDVDQRKTVSEGQATVLNFPDISSFPRPQVTWFRDGHKIIPSSRMPAFAAWVDNMQKQANSSAAELPILAFCGSHRPHFPF